MLLPGLHLQAQNLNYGFQAGFGISKPQLAENSFSSSQVFFSMASFNLNGHIEYRFPGMLSISAEPGFIRKGGAVDGINRIMENFKIQLNYVQVPILANFYFTDRIFVCVGSEFAYLLNTDGNLDFNQDAFTPFENNAFEVSGLAGVNYSISKRIDLGFRYNHSLTPFPDVHWTDIYGEELGQAKAYNQYFQLIARYKIKPDADKP